ncbi:hypothetical protein T01_3396 [Trichinella spiralis]|uniref:Uncharacterized protein n=1 Tax=Trichinella spiralis TaxID=6334 RepID=A0A0V1BKX7_TRISP|nr:hypothetical protein T01_3396 [Trichinella spiralis]
MIITLRQSSTASARIDLSCLLCRLMKPVLMPTSVHLAFQWRFLAVPVCLYLSQINHGMFILNSSLRAVESLKYWYVASKVKGIEVRHRGKGKYEALLYAEWKDM